MTNNRYLLLALGLLLFTGAFAQKPVQDQPAQAYDKATAAPLPAAVATETLEMEQLPYHQIPDYPAEYNACTVVARMVDGLGFRYYWATEGLRPEDLEYKASPEGRTIAETLDHLHGLVRVVRNAVAKEPTLRPQPEEDMDFATKRKRTLLLLQEASQILLNSTDEDMASFNIVFQRGDNVSEFPFWNNLNGPLADALWHTGQVVMLRRASGNPFNSKVSVFSGKVRE